MTLLVNAFRGVHPWRPARKPGDEGQAERQEDVRQVQGDPPSRSGHGDLRQPAAQAAAGL